MPNTPHFEIDNLRARILQEKNALPILKQVLKDFNVHQEQKFWENFPVHHLVLERAQFIDQLLELAWNHQHLENHDVALAAVGGYGRGELHPQSDVDILVLHTVNLDEENDLAEQLQAFITLIWDIGLQIGHSVRTVRECVQEAASDITIISNLMESRLICGDTALFNEMRENISPEHIWPLQAFVTAKLKEQHNRYLKFNETAYNLEPNIKEGPGGLRDIQMIGWVAKRHFGVNHLKELIGHNFLTSTEYEQLEKGQNFLWKIRFALHVMKNRPEERLLFDFQREIAARFGYTDGDGRLAVEHFMKSYYLTVMELERLNEMLLQYFQEVIIYSDTDAPPRKINQRFMVYKGYLAAANENVFRNYPFAMLEIFYLLCQNPDLHGIRASTIRLIRAHRYLIDDTFRKDLRCRSLFMEILRQPHGLTHQIRRMNRYGVLAEYLPEFKRIVGQMQHDLYHAYTVDEHTLKVLRNVRRISLRAHANELPLCSHIIKDLPKPELLYIAALYHDIGKGRGGDHSEIGALEVEKFAQRHDLSHFDTRIVVWLVRHHLVMSVTAQRKDLGDPTVIHDFATLVGDRLHLDYLYLLTVADIRGTSPKVWNSWKDSLLKELYSQTLNALNEGLLSPLQQNDYIAQLQTKLAATLEQDNFPLDAVNSYWKTLPHEYFLKNSDDDILWQTRAVLEHQKSDKPLITTRILKDKSGTEIFIRACEKHTIFALVTTTLAQLMLDIMEAKTLTTSDSFTNHTYTVLEEDGTAVEDPRRLKDIVDEIHKNLARGEIQLIPPNRTLPRTFKQFALDTHVRFDEDLENNQTIMEITASNRPSLLSRIAHALLECEVSLLNAKISTFGEKVEDVFYIRDAGGRLITDIKQQEQIRNTIIRMTSEGL